MRAESFAAMPAIQADGLYKAFPIYKRPHHRLLQMLWPGDSRRWYHEFHALNDVSLTVSRGETVGIVGRNGSGKSTLLQIICGTLAPSSGQLEVRGRIAALLELGAGFNPEFTGRENVFLNGAILGLDHASMRERFDRIAAFADIGEFMEQPVKTYSSGMYVRLAFAVAINVEPDILVVDEALSVGDEAFQRKCFARIEAIRQAGATILFVSHSAATVIDLCDRAILLDRGEVIADGQPKHVVALYQKLMFASPERAEEVRRQAAMLAKNPEASQAIAALEDAGALLKVGNAAGTDESAAYWEEGLKPSSTINYARRGARIVSARIETPQGRPVNVLVPGEEYAYCYEVEADQTLTGVRFGMLIRTVTGVELAGAVTAQAETALPVVERGRTAQVRFRFRCRLAPGGYFLNAGVLAQYHDGEQYADRRIDIAMFRVMPQTDRLATALVDLEFQPAVEVAS